MTSLSQYLRAERMDNTQPASFYTPGADSWDDPHLYALRARTIFAKLMEDEPAELDEYDEE